MATVLSPDCSAHGFAQRFVGSALPGASRPHGCDRSRLKGKALTSQASPEPLPHPKVVEHVDPCLQRPRPNRNPQAIQPRTFKASFDSPSRFSTPMPLMHFHIAFASKCFVPT